MFFGICVFAQNAENKQKIQAPYIPTPKNRVGISFASTPWASLGLLFDYDRREVFPDYHWTLGFEAGVYGFDLTLEPRILWWEHLNMSGFYIGPKASFVVGDYHRHHHNYQTFFGIGVEGGWVYRFPENFDLGAGLDVSLTNKGPWAALKFSAGYLF